MASASSSHARIGGRTPSTTQVETADACHPCSRIRVPGDEFRSPAIWARERLTLSHPERKRLPAHDGPTQPPGGRCSNRAAHRRLGRHP